MPAYNGHKNWNHWNVSLWINNDERLYRAALQCLDGRSLDMAAKHMYVWLADTHTPDGAPYSISAIKAAMRGLRD